MTSHIRDHNQSEKPTIEDRRYACPGFFRMPKANDGGICRVKLPLGNLLLSQMNGIADAADNYSDSQIELTSRGNIQLRAVQKENEEKLVEALLALKLGPLTPGGDDVRNVMVPPTAGIDRSMLCDTTVIGTELLHMLQTHDEFFAISPKFSFLVNGGETTTVIDHIADIWLSISPDGQRFNFGYASRPDYSTGCANASGSVPLDRGLELIKVSLEVFVRFLKNNPAISRMKHLRKLPEFDSFLNMVFDHFSSDAGLPVIGVVDAAYEQALIGKFPQRESGRYYVGARPALGRLTSEQMRLLFTALKPRQSQSPIRITHHQSIIVPDCDDKEADAILNNLASIGLSVDKNDATSNIFCCAGAPFCHSGLSNVQRDGKTLISHLSKKSITPLHLTACAKACVATAPFPYTAVAKKDGYYSLYSAQTSHETKFGKLLADNMSTDELAEYFETEVSKAG